jgi:alpha-maltose-1-phosphate synthase
VGRITRQKGVPLLRAATQLDPEMQLVLCAGQPDTPELAQEVTQLVNALRATRSGVIWIEGMLNRHEVIQLLSHATAFVCPSLYEPLGIVNLEAMACVPRSSPHMWAASRRWLQTARPACCAPGLPEALGRCAISEFHWTSIALQTAKLYQEVAV